MVLQTIWIETSCLLFSLMISRYSQHLAGTTALVSCISWIIYSLDGPLDHDSLVHMLNTWKKKSYFPSCFFTEIYIFSPEPTAECEKLLLPAFLHLNYDAQAGIRINQGERGGRRRCRARQQRYQAWEYTHEAIKWTRNRSLICYRWKTCFPLQINTTMHQSRLFRRSSKNRSLSLVFWLVRRPNVSRM